MIEEFYLLKRGYFSFKHFILLIIRLKIRIKRLIFSLKIRIKILTRISDPSVENSVRLFGSQLRLVEETSSQHLLAENYFNFHFYFTFLFSYFGQIFACCIHILRLSFCSCNLKQN